MATDRANLVLFSSCAEHAPVLTRSTAAAFSVYYVLVFEPDWTFDLRLVEKVIYFQLIDCLWCFVLHNG